MSIHSVDDYDPTSSTPIFGAAVSQTKIQQQQQPTNNDLAGTEKLITPPQPVTNGQNDTTNNKSNENLGNGTTEALNGNTHTAHSTDDVHVNGQNKNTGVDTNTSLNLSTKDTVNSNQESIPTSGASNPIEKSSQNDSIPATSSESTGNVTSTVSPPTGATALKESEPALSVSADVAKEDLSAAPAAPASNVGPPPPGPPVETSTTTATASNDDVPVSATAPEATVLAQSSTPERKTKVIFFLTNIFNFVYIK